MGANHFTLILQAITLPFFWLTIFAATTMIGFAFVPFKKQQGILCRNLFTWFWYGLGITVAFLQIWNLFLPISLFTWIVVVPFIIYGGAKQYRDKLHFNFTRPNYLIFTLGFSVLIFLIFSSLDHSFSYDALTYHFYTIKWFNNYRVTPGMGNVIFMLGYNHSYFLYPAFLNSLWDNYRGVCATNGMLAIVMCAEIILNNTRYLLKKEPFTVSSIFQLLFLPLCINIGVQNLTSPTSDVAVNLLTLRILLDTINVLEAKKITFQDIFIIGFYCLLGVILKTSFIGIGMGGLLLPLFLLFKEKLWSIRLIIQSLAIYTILFVPWIIRAIICSGYIGFPLSVIGLPVDWKIPKHIVDNCADYTRGISRSYLHGEGALKAAHGYGWIPAWTKRMLTTFGSVVPLLLFISTVTFLKIKKIKFTKVLFVFIPISVSLIVWFITAPDLRFAVFTFWALALLPISFLISQQQEMRIGLFPLFIYVCSLLIMIKNWNTDPQLLGDLPKVERSVFVTKSGLKVNTIKGTPPNDDWQIGDCPIPCSVYPDSGLMLRGKSIQDGFRIK